MDGQEELVIAVMQLIHYESMPAICARGGSNALSTHTHSPRVAHFYKDGKELLTHLSIAILCHMILWILEKCFDFESIFYL